MNMNVEFHFDFGSPNAYLAHLVIPAIEKRSGVRFAHAVLLGCVQGHRQRRRRSRCAGSRTGEYAALETRRFLAKHGITRFAANPFFPVNTLQIMRGAVAAQRVGCFERYVDEVYRHMWADPKKMDEPAVIRAALLESGLPADQLLARATDPDVKQELIANTDASVARGVFGSPSFFVGDELFFGKDRLREVEEEIEAQRPG
jgi:2-hydroxychromene-2-carboxylate isomerase